MEASEETEDFDADFEESYDIPMKLGKSAKKTIESADKGDLLIGTVNLDDWQDNDDNEFDVAEEDIAHSKLKDDKLAVNKTIEKEEIILDVDRVPARSTSQSKLKLDKLHLKKQYIPEEVLGKETISTNEAQPVPLPSPSRLSIPPLMLPFSFTSPSQPISGSINSSAAYVTPTAIPASIISTGKSIFG
jgi:hypothetical protein